LPYFKSEWLIKLDTKIKRKGKMMKSKILFVFILCLALASFSIQSNAEPKKDHKDRLIGLDSKIDEIIDVLKMNLVWENTSEIEQRLTGFFQKYKNNSENFKFFLATETGPGDEEEDPAEMAKHLNENKDKDIKFKRKRIEYEAEELEANEDDNKIDARAIVKLEFSWTQSPEHTGLIVIELFHMKKCIWD
jgi:hypothetical protein